MDWRKPKMRIADTLRKTIDKLTKKLAQYEDYDKPRYRLDEMNEGGGSYFPR
jgi:hypothetical protein